MKSSTCSAPWDFLLPFPFFLYSHITSCIRDSLHFVRRFAPSKCVRCGTSSILFSPTKKKASCASRRDAFFLALSLPPYLSFNLLHPRSRSFARRFTPSNDVRCGTSSILLSPTIMKSSTCSAPWDFLLPFPFFLYSHITSCIRDSLHFVRRFAHSKCVRCGTSSILLSPTIMKSSTCSAPWDFLLPFPFFLYSHITSCIRDSLHFVRRFAHSKCVRCGTSSILLSPTIMKSSTCSAPWDFLLPFPFSLICHSPCP